MEAIYVVVEKSLLRPYLRFLVERALGLPFMISPGPALGAELRRKKKSACCGCGMVNVASPLPDERTTVLAVGAFKVKVVRIFCIACPKAPGSYD
jgi:hypothetical protein